MHSSPTLIRHKTKERVSFFLYLPPFFFFFLIFLFLRQRLSCAPHHPHPCTFKAMEREESGCGEGSEVLFHGALRQGRL